MNNIDTQIAEFEQAVKKLWDTHPREFCLLQTDIILAQKAHKPTKTLRRRLELLRALQVAEAAE